MRDFAWQVSALVTLLIPMGLLLLVTAGTGYAQTFDPISAHDALLAEAEGYFKAAGGTGGQGGSPQLLIPNNRVRDQLADRPDERRPSRRCRRGIDGRLLEVLQILEEIQEGLEEEPTEEMYDHSRTE